MTISNEKSVLPGKVSPGAVRRGTQIRLTGVTKDYGLALPAVNNVSLTIEPGEFMTFLGPSGSGKTTTLNLIAGFDTLSKGTIALNGTDVGTLPPHKRNLGMLFQNYALFPHMTVAQNVGYPLRERKMAKTDIARRVSDVLDLVRLPGRDENYPAQLSGGQQQRVALARAIVFQPEALLLDEPLGALDRNLRGTLQEEIRRIHREVGSTFVFVTHDQDEAMNLSDRIALFNNGCIEQVGTPEQLYRAPETLFTAKFLGDSNVFDLGDAGFGTQAGWEDRTWSVDSRTVASHAGVLSHAAIVVRPEDLMVTRDPSSVPAGANTVSASVADLEYMGSYRTALLHLGRSKLRGRARIDASDSLLNVGDSITAWWKPERQRIVSA
ncbi:ABC transporter ATP-binding protein [Arthrobacter sp. zg-Y826]|uniref:ABC transporter ATP-binding protein n=1 Tax=Arthrobacter jinronghuae TaxID=2964609 RepID=UPI00210681B9|nr:ABC transporter ATP-binding protein [Arthrobacter jinronghuae]MCQ1957531.1 ABC transporter ATP-binding protein [Arthrobacter jinronghuae]